jgi:hypothetical protein
MVLSCSNKITVLGEYKKHFGKKEIIEIIGHSDPEKNLTEMVIGVVDINDSAKVGLYTYKLYKSPQSVQALYKVLKFETKIVFPSANKETDKAILNEFETNYSLLFTKEQLNHIKESFLKGTEISGRTY